MKRNAGNGGVSWPWGADKLFPKAGVELKVSKLDNFVSRPGAHGFYLVGHGILGQDIQGVETKWRKEPVRL